MTRAGCNHVGCGTARRSAFSRTKAAMCKSAAMRLACHGDHTPSGHVTFDIAFGRFQVDRRILKPIQWHFGGNQWDPRLTAVAPLEHVIPVAGVWRPTACNRACGTNAFSVENRVYRMRSEERHPPATGAIPSQFLIQANTTRPSVRSLLVASWLQPTSSWLQTWSAAVPTLSLNACLDDSGQSFRLSSG